MYHNKYLKSDVFIQSNLDISIDLISINITTLSGNILTIEFNSNEATFNNLISLIQTHLKLSINEVQYLRIIADDIVQPFDILLTFDNFIDLHNFVQIHGQDYNPANIPIDEQTIYEIFPNHKNIINLTLIILPITEIITKYFEWFNFIINFPNFTLIFNSYETESILDTCYDKHFFLSTIVQHLHHFQFKNDVAIRKIFKKPDQPYDFDLIRNNTLCLDNLQLITINLLRHGDYSNRNNIGILRFLLRQSFFGLILYAPLSFLIKFISCSSSKELPSFFQTKTTKINSWEVIFKPRIDALIDFLKCLSIFTIPFYVGPENKLIKSNDIIGLDIIIQLLKDHQAKQINGEILDVERKEELFKRKIEESIGNYFQNPIHTNKFRQLFSNNQIKKIFFNPIDESIFSEHDFLTPINYI
jgi:hypothetical protein